MTLVIYLRVFFIGFMTSMLSSLGYFLLDLWLLNTRQIVLYTDKFWTVSCSISSVFLILFKVCLDVIYKGYSLLKSIDDRLVSNNAYYLKVIP